MAYSESLADRVREKLAEISNITEKKMFSGLAFMVNEKMCICITKQGLMCRTDPDRFTELTQKNGVQPMVMRGKEMTGYLLVNEEAVSSSKALQFWIDACLGFNPKAQSSKKKKSNHLHNK